MPTPSAALLAIAVVAGLVVLAQNPRRNAAQAAGDVIPPAAIMQSEGDLQHPTPRQECRFFITDSLQRLWTLGVESDGSEQLNATRQAIVLGRFENVHWSAVESLVDNW